MWKGELVRQTHVSLQCSSLNVWNQIASRSSLSILSGSWFLLKPLCWTLQEWEPAESSTVAKLPPLGTIWAHGNEPDQAKIEQWVGKKSSKAIQNAGGCCQKQEHKSSHCAHLFWVCMFPLFWASSTQWGNSIIWCHCPVFALGTLSGCLKRISLSFSCYLIYHILSTVSYIPINLHFTWSLLSPFQVFILHKNFSGIYPA